MKNRISLFIVAAILFTAVLGCSSINPFSGKGKSDTQSSKDKTITDKAVDVAVGDEKIGIPECDEVVDFFNREINNPDDDFVTKAVKQTALNQFKEKFKQAVEENKTNKVELAKTCREFKQNLDKYKAEEEEGKKKQ